MSAEHDAVWLSPEVAEPVPLVWVVLRWPGEVDWWGTEGTVPLCGLGRLEPNAYRYEPSDPAMVWVDENGEECETPSLWTSVPDVKRKENRR